MRRQQSVATVMPFACQHEKAGVIWQTADLLKILEDRVGNRHTRFFHRRPFSRFGFEQTCFPCLCLGAGKHRMR